MSRGSVGVRGTSSSLLQMSDMLCGVLQRRARYRKRMEKEGLLERILVKEH